MSQNVTHYLVCGRPEKSNFFLCIEALQKVQEQHQGTRNEIQFDKVCYTAVDWEDYIQKFTLDKSSFLRGCETFLPSDVWERAQSAVETRQQLFESHCVVLEFSHSDRNTVRAFWTGELYLTYVSRRYRQITIRTPHTVQDRLFEDQLQKTFISFLKSRGYVYVWMDVKCKGSECMQEFEGRITFELFQTVCPLTVENFRQLCRGTTGNEKLSYVNSQIHRIIPGGFIQGGDTVNKAYNNAGTSGRSIYGDKMNDECFDVSHNSEGILGMVNDGPHTASSQFYITLAPCHWMDQKYVAFGRVIDGLELIRLLGRVPTRQNQVPRAEIQIQKCGEIILD